jgi:hypothetical protein
MSNAIEYVSGDLFEPTKQDTNISIITHVVNSKGAWGAGFVIPLGKIFPVSKQAYLAWAGKADEVPNEAVWHPPFELGQVQFVQVRKTPLLLVANMLAQRLGGDRPLYYSHLVHCMEEVAKYVVRLRHRHSCPVTIRCPLFGAGLAGGNWDFIEKLIEDCWLRFDIPVVTYFLPDALPDGWTPPCQFAPTEPPVDFDENPRVSSGVDGPVISPTHEDPRLADVVPEAVSEALGLADTSQKDESEGPTDEDPQ